MSIRVHTFTMECMSGTLGDYIVEMRNRLGINQTELSRRSGVERTTVNRIEKGVTKLPSALVRRQIANALGVRHVDLLIAAGELAENEVEIPEFTPSRAVEMLAPTIDSYLWTEADIDRLERVIAAIPEPVQKSFDLGGAEE